MEVKYYQVIAVLLFFGASQSSGGVTPTTKDPSIIAYYLQLYNAINSYRAMHTIPALRWNRTLTQTAETFAAMAVSQINSNSFDSEHWTGCNFYLADGAITRPRAILVASTWYDEFGQYDFRNPGYSSEYNNFTQMIWKGSTSVGIGLFTDGDSNVTAVVAKFYPAGNLRGAYRQNVIPIYVKN